MRMHLPIKGSRTELNYHGAGMPLCPRSGRCPCRQPEPSGSRGISRSQRCPAFPGARLRLLNKTSRAISLPGRHLSEDREVNAMRPRRQKKHSSGDLKINVKLYNMKSFCWGKKLSTLLWTWRLVSSSKTTAKRSEGGGWWGQPLAHRRGRDLG